MTNRHTNRAINLSNENVLVSFAKPKYNDGGTRMVVGLIQQLNLSQQRQVQRLFEVGNEEVELVPSKTVNRLQINRVLFDGPSLMKYYAYAYVPQNQNINNFDSDSVRNPRAIHNMDGSERYELLDHFADEHADRRGYNEQYEAMIGRIVEWLGYDADQEGVNTGWSRTPHDQIPGTADFWINLSSKLFEHPIGIVLELEQGTPRGENEDYGGVFLENCVISSHNLSTRADQRILSENLTIDVGKVKPLKEYAGEDIISIETKFKHPYGRTDN